MFSEFLLKEAVGLFRWGDQSAAERQHKNKYTKLDIKTSVFRGQRARLNIHAAHLQHELHV
jgi:hypothetical protein